MALSPQRLIRLTRKELAGLIEQGGGGISSEDRDEMAIPTYLDRNPLIQWLFWKRHEIILRLAGLQGTEQVMDFGCGIGAMLPSLCAYAGGVYGVDLFPGVARALCEKRGLDATLLTDKEVSGAIPDRGLDLIIAADSMEHLDDLQGTISLFQAKMKPDARLIVSGPTESPLYQFLRGVAGFGDKGGYHHTNIHDIVDQIMKNGFRMLNSCSIPFFQVSALFRIVEFVKST